MDFKATRWIERNYKWIMAVIVIAFSSYGLHYYINLEDKSDTFIAASLYALILFTVGIFMNYMNYIIADQFQDRIKIYLNLMRVHSFFKVRNEELDNYENVRKSIITFQVFTCRSEGIEDKGITPLIREIGLKFNSKELRVEDKYLDLYSSISTTLSKTINSYVKNNQISIRGSAFVNDIFSFMPEEWCKDNLVNYSTDGRRMVNHLYKKLNSMSNEYAELELLGYKIIRLYSKYYYWVKINIKQIEKLYGRKLQYEIAQQSEIQQNFDYLFESLRKIENRIIGEIQEHDEKVDDSFRYFEQRTITIESIIDAINEVKDVVDKDSRF